MTMRPTIELGSGRGGRPLPRLTIVDPFAIEGRRVTERDSIESLYELVDCNV